MEFLVFHRLLCGGRDFFIGCNLYVGYHFFFAAANESTRKRVIFYTATEYLLLALASSLQVLYIRRLFSKSVAYNRV
mgnify:CR=1 FL=1